jgi:hypothetical protein
MMDPGINKITNNAKKLISIFLDLFKNNYCFKVFVNIFQLNVIKYIYAFCFDFWGFDESVPLSFNFYYYAINAKIVFKFHIAIKSCLILMKIIFLIKLNVLVKRSTLINILFMIKIKISNKDTLRNTYQNKISFIKFSFFCVVTFTLRFETFYYKFKILSCYSA